MKKNKQYFFAGNEISSFAYFATGFAGIALFAAPFVLAAIYLVTKF